VEELFGVDEEGGGQVLEGAGVSGEYSAEMVHQIVRGWVAAGKLGMKGGVEVSEEMEGSECG
jgi:polyhydroxyalkanoate synthesis regulator phasin